jgi:hypothetical protein
MKPLGLPVRAFALVVTLVAAAFSFDNGPAYYGRWQHGLPGDTSYFPIAVWLQSPSNAAAYTATGINLYIGLWQGPTLTQLQDLKAANMQVMCEQNSVALANLTGAGTCIAGWTMGDEPDNAQSNGSGGYDPCISPDTIKAQYARWRAADSTRPVFLNLGRGVSDVGWYGRGTCTNHTEMYPEYIKGCDIASYDIYPVTDDGMANQGMLWYVPKGVDSLIMWGNDQKPAWCWIECTHVNSATSKPTPAQVRSEVWMALIHGAKGIGYFCHEFAPAFQEAAWLNDAPMKSAITAINQRIHALAPVLCTPNLSPVVPVASSNHNVPVDRLVKQHGGYVYVFAAAMRNDTTTATFTLASSTINASAEVLDESRSVPVTNGVMRDSFSGYQVHLYRIQMILPILQADRRVPGSCLTSSVHRGESGPGAAAFALDGRRVLRISSGCGLVRTKNGEVRKMVGSVDHQ